MHITAEALARHKAFFDQNGYVIVPAVFDADEIAAYRQHYMDMAARGQCVGDQAGIIRSKNWDGDPLKKYPRLISMHLEDEVSRNYLLNARLNRCLTAILGAEPLAAQTMLYFKPPGARGQALHQDNYYLKAAPGTCMAAWTALDDCDDDNGCMQVIPGSHKWETLCTLPADTRQSFTDRTVPIPPDAKVAPCYMCAGDVLFFNGQLVHGSQPNKTPDRFRRALIAHYLEGFATHAASYMKPLYRMDGTEVQLESTPGGGPCGVWVDIDGNRAIENTGTHAQFVAEIH